MIDSVRVVLPVQEALRSGRLELPEEAARGFVSSPLAWGDHPANYILIVIFTLLALISLRRLLSIFPRLIDSLTRWKACVNIEASLQVKTDRNLLGILYTIPIALMMDKYELLQIDAMELIPEGLHGLVTTGAIFIWLLIRRFIYLVLSARVRKVEMFRTAYYSFFNFWILAGFLTVCTASLAAVLNVGSALAGRIIFYEIMLLYAIALLRKHQILRSFCNPFITFLYLCALEFIPTGALIAGVILL